MVGLWKIARLVNTGGLPPEFDPGQIVQGHVVYSPDEGMDLHPFVGRRWDTMVITRLVAWSVSMTGERPLESESTGVGLRWNYYNILVYGRFIGRRRKRGKK